MGVPTRHINNEPIVPPACVTALSHFHSDMVPTCTLIKEVLAVLVVLTLIFLLLLEGFALITFKNLAQLKYIDNVGSSWIPNQVKSNIYIHICIYILRYILSFFDQLHFYFYIISF